MRRLLVLLIVLACANAQAASLRSMTTLHGPNVYVRDLFDDAGPNADRMLGPGPEPGGRIIVESAQLSAIARQYDVGWRSVSRADRAVLEWPGRPMKKEDAIEAVRLAITAAGAADDIDIDMPGFTPPVVPVEAAAVPTVSRLDYDRATGRFNAALTVTGEGMNPIDTRVSGQVVEMLDAPVALTRLLPETVLRAEDVRIARVRTALLRNDVARSLDQVVGMELRRPLAAGQPLSLTDLIRPPLVQRGATVRIELSAGGLSVTGQAVALDAGAQGEKVRVQNLTSRAFLFAEVTGPGQVRVMPNAGAALPTVPARYDSRLNQ
ncbi:MAG TPA: flagella basal body P-ring formation protein FlgA [Acetobacteraceae bacterium]|jgi:flagellar basal body P-ring formation protein FlgA|nr:flagella basal body P-ring formation protein FlgA [Acetobacteraceae bacterium]